MRLATRSIVRTALILAGATLLSFASQANALHAQPANAGAPPFSVKVVGKGRPMLLIPGLTGGGSVWDGTVEALKNNYQLHVFTLAGFAGQPAPTVDSTWLARMRDAIVAYAKQQRLVKPVIVGHSLGGFLALWIGATAPELPGTIINIDGLPFLGAAADLNATVATVRPQADAMRGTITGAAGNGAASARMQEAQLRAMIRDTTKLPIAMEMGRASDPRTTAEAMYELYTTDLRDALGPMKAPVLNLHAWAAYKNYGVTRERTDAMLASQYRTLRTGTTRVNDSTDHFIMFDEPAWMLSEMRAFLAGMK